MCGTYLASRVVSSDYMTLGKKNWPYLCCEFSFGISLAKVGQLGAENNSVKQTHRHYANLFIDFTQLSKSILLKQSHCNLIATYCVIDTLCVKREQFFLYEGII